MMAPLEQAPRLLLQAALRPVQGDRFVPANFPDLGPCEYLSARGTTHLLVDSVPSVANRLEAVVWDDDRGCYIEALSGLPFVAIEHPEYGRVASVEDPCRLGSPYIYPLLAPILEQEVGGQRKGQRTTNVLARLLFRLDPGCLLHGAFFPKLRSAPGVTRLLTAFIDAKDVGVMESGGVRLDAVDESGPSSEGRGNILFARREYISDEITGHFNLDLQRLRRYGLSPEGEELMIGLAVYKVLLFLERGLRLRSACDLEVVELRVTRPAGYEIPTMALLEDRLRTGIALLRERGELGEPLVLRE